MKNKQYISLISNISKSITVFSIVGLMITVAGSNLTSNQESNFKKASAADLSFQNGMVKIDKKFITVASPTNNDIGTDGVIVGTNSTITVRLNYENTGDFSADNAQITDSIPNGFSLVNNSFRNCLIPSADSTDQFCSPAFNPGSSVVSGSNITISPSAGLYDIGAIATDKGTGINSAKGTLEIAKRRYIHNVKCSSNPQAYWILTGFEPLTNSETINPAIVNSTFGTCPSADQKYESYALLNNRFIHQYRCLDSSILPYRQWFTPGKTSEPLGNSQTISPAGMAVLNVENNCPSPTPTVNTGYNLLGNRFIHYYICTDGNPGRGFVITGQIPTSNNPVVPAASLAAVDAATSCSVPGTFVQGQYNGASGLAYDMKDTAGSTRSKGFIEYKMTASSAEGSYSTDASLKTDFAQTPAATDPATGNVITVTIPIITNTQAQALNPNCTAGFTNTTTTCTLTIPASMKLPADFKLGVGTTPGGSCSPLTGSVTCTLVPTSATAGSNIIKFSGTGLSGDTVGTVLLTNNIPNTTTSSSTSTTQTNSNKLTGAIGSTIPSNIPLGLNSSYEGKLAEFYYPGSTIPVFGKIMNGGFVPNSLSYIPNSVLTGDQSAIIKIGNEQYSLPTNFSGTVNSSSTNSISSITSCVGGFLPSAGSTFCSDCPAGSYCQGTTKIACPSGLTSLPKSTSSSDCKTSVDNSGATNTTGSKFAIKDPYTCGGEITGNVSGFVTSTDKVVVKVTKVSTSEAFVSDAPVDVNGDYRVSTSSITSDDYYIDYYLLRNGQEVARGNRYVASIRKPDECNTLKGSATTLVGSNNTNSGISSAGLTRTGGSQNLILGFVIMIIVSATASYLTNSHKNSKVSSNWKKL